MNKRWSFLGLLAFVAFAPGCGPDIQDLCEKQESCVGGNDADIDACVAINDDLRGAAYDIGCGEEFDARFECRAPIYDCVTTKTCTTSDECNGSRCINGECKAYAVDQQSADKCQTEDNAYGNCR